MEIKRVADPQATKRRPRPPVREFPFSKSSRRDVDDVLTYVFGDAMSAYRVPVLSSRCIELVKNADGSPKLLGSGPCSRVFLGKIEDNFVALKLMKKSTSTVADVVREAALRWRLRSSCALPVTHGLFRFETNDVYHQYGIVSEFVGDQKSLKPTTLSDLVNKVQNNFSDDDCPLISRRDWLQILTNIAKNLDIIHRQDIVVNGLNLKNILIRKESAEWVPYINGLSAAGLNKVHVTVNLQSEDEAGFEDFKKSLPHIPEEVVFIREATAATDVYSLGHVMATVDRALPDLLLKCSDIADFCRDPDMAARPVPSLIVSLLDECKDIELTKKPRSRY